jgi:ribonuclease P protein component
MFASALADAKSGAEGARLGLTVSRKVGNAVKRNRVKRVLRDWFRRHRLDCPAAAIVFVARNGAAEAPADALRAEADDIVRRMARRLSEGRRPRTDRPDRSERPETPR